jgi:sulfur relay (sulfurtransferase) DsrC/TusE family protein
MTCKTHPDAPHGFDRNGSHSEDRYVCMCEHWEPPQPDPMELVRDLEKFATNPSERMLAKELGSLLFDHSTLKVENAKLKKDLHHYMLAANAEAELVDELQRENESILLRITEANKPVIERINAYLAQDEALLRQAADMLATLPVKHPDQIAPRDALITAIKERLNG